ncbi:hypothetical protein C8J56DRAFT_892912 [Mycena floridula]|nr:hypothetical protein C8J56DRAFT_892912 [Mycena floridula]
MEAHHPGFMVCWEGQSVEPQTQQSPQRIASRFGLTNSADTHRDNDSSQVLPRNTWRHGGSIELRSVETRPCKTSVDVIRVAREEANKHKWRCLGSPYVGTPAADSLRNTAGKILPTIVSLLLDKHPWPPGVAEFWPK